MDNPECILLDNQPLTLDLPMTRQQTLKTIRDNPNVSVLIIGGGINGIGTFRDLALQGIDVLLVDKGDFCSGTSAASSHMVHGGIRYLENGEFRLVKEAVKERNRLVQNAPHAVKPLATAIPIFRWLSGLFNAPLKFIGLLDKPAERGAVVIKAGLEMYDAYTRAQGTVPKHRFMLRREALKEFPKLNPGIQSTAVYFDAAMPSPERICIELMLDGEAANPQARAINYMQAEQAHGNTVTLRDMLTDESIDVRPQIVINAAGPWIDLANQALGQQTRFIGGTKGSHLVLDHPALHAALKGHEFFFENDDGRIVLIYPLLNKVLVGTSDIRIDNPEAARCTDEEIDYFLEMIDKVFPKLQVDRSHIVFQFSGVRPLPSSEASTTGQISRDHSIRTIEPNDTLAFPIMSLIGGKWTTFRAFSEQTADTVLKRLGQPRQSHTKNTPIGGGRDYPQTDAEQEQWLANLQQQAELPLPRLQQLFDRYGTRAADIAKFMAAENDAPLPHHDGYSQREIVFLAAQEKTVHLDDLILRRTLIGMLGETTLPLVEALAKVVGDTLDWSAEDRANEVQRTVDLLRERHDVTLT